MLVICFVYFCLNRKVLSQSERDVDDLDTLHRYREGKISQKRQNKHEPAVQEMIPKENPFLWRITKLAGALFSSFRQLQVKM